MTATATAHAAPATETEARDVAEAARETEWEHPSFVRELYLGRFRLDLVHPFPEKHDAAEEQRARAFHAKLRAFLERYPADDIDRTGDIPEPLVQELRDMGAFGIKIPLEYGGLGLSQMSYIEAMSMVGSKDGALGALLSAHQSIGVPQPLKLFGTNAQKAKYFPRIAKGAITAFALTEVNAGSDPANMTTSATPSADGTSWTINGEKLWCTNGTRAELYVVMARTPDVVVKGKPRKQITAFIVERSAPGVSIKHRCRFMGLKAIENGVIHFDNVKVPAENILWGEGKGLKLALITLNTGRLTIPASIAGGCKSIVRAIREWANERVQWGQPIAKHDAIAHRIASMTADAFAMESVARLATALYERGGTDIRLEAAVAKLFNSERGWRLVDDAMQVRGGRGYETSVSLHARGEKAIPIERMMRDARINMIFEGSSEIMRLFTAREAVDAHFSIAFPIVGPGYTMAQRLTAFVKAIPFYATWYPARWIPSLRTHSNFGPLAKHVRWMERRTRKLGRALFHAMVRFGPKLEKRQMVLFRAVDIGAELFAMAAACARAQQLVAAGNATAYEPADAFCNHARARINESFRTLFGANDTADYRFAQNAVAGKYAWIEDGVVEDRQYDR
ncbi:MAG TPA: acyl-CoA dehydrogenase family protein [Gemmatimonadaceae bacterium]|nr:acyl-CoA dehydrogenase family protein [Gemmatimonadaceae bacterium]